MVEHWSEKPGVDSSILSLGILFRPNFVSYFVDPLLNLFLNIQRIHRPERALVGSELFTYFREFFNDGR